MKPRFSFLHRTRAVILAAALLMWTVPALAGGPLEPPDGVGNPDFNDYSGYFIVALFPGVRENSSQRTRFQCFNAGGATADNVVVQFYSANGSASRAPTGIDGLASVVDPGEAPSDDTEFGVTGSVSDRGIARIIAIDSVRRRNPALNCSATIETAGTGTTIGSLQRVDLPRKKKKR